MSLMDWSIMAGLMIFLVYATMTAKKYNRSVADFLVANRCAGRYLLGTAEFTAMLGAVGSQLHFMEGNRVVRVKADFMMGRPSFMEGKQFSVEKYDGLPHLMRVN